MKLYIIRHGETDWNKQQLIQGHSDNPLNQTGISQAKTIGKFFVHINLDLIISSSLIRAQSTAQIATGIRPDIIDDSFIERNFGHFEGQSVQSYRKTQNNFSQGFETDAQICNRVMTGLSNYYQSSFQTIAIFAHSHVLKAVLTTLQPTNYNFASVIPNCAILELELVDNKLEIIDIHTQ